MPPLHHLLLFFRGVVEIAVFSLLQWTSYCGNRLVKVTRIRLIQILGILIDLQLARNLQVLTLHLIQSYQYHLVNLELDAWAYLDLLSFIL